ncbi:hypothetical protein ACFOYU_21575 [Microvirga sp. GCM10011540]|uniref:hypothetical protein n=1 Tax=Microvirga sp. GCM10011540 TaxID=3317338 RepID=UPI00361DC5AD
MSRTLTTELASGAMAGAAAVWVMDRADWLMVAYEDPAAWSRTKEVRPNHKDPAHNMAGMAAKAVGAEPPPEPHPAGLAIHYALGMGPAAVYSTLREHVPGGVVGRGALLGLGMFLIEDEVLNPVLGTAAPPQRYPWQAHARSVVAHLVFGIATEAMLSLLDRSRHPGRSKRSTQNRSRRPA